MVDQAEVHRMAHSNDVSERRKALKQLEDSFSILDDKEQAWKDLLTLAKDMDSDVRGSVAGALGRVFVHVTDKEQAWKDLLTLAKDMDSDVRWRTAYARGSAFAHVTDKEQATKDLLALTKDKHNGVRRGAAYTLGSAFAHVTDKEQATKDLLALTKDLDSDVRRGAAGALASAFIHVTDKEQATKDLLALTKDKDRNVRSDAADALGSAFAHVTDKEQAWKDLLALTKGKDSGVRWHAASALGSAFAHVTDKEQATKDLLALTKDKYDLVRMEAADALGSAYTHDTDKSTASNDLYRLRREEDLDVRINAASSDMNELNDSLFNNKIEVSVMNSEASIQKASASDQPSVKDFLGFEPYVQAIYEFLKNPATKPPLTLSIEGPWGIGKSSFMSQLKQKFDEDKALTVEFNPWRHDKEDSLWASFAIEFINQLNKNLAFRQKVKRYMVLLRLRFKWGSKTLNRLIFISLTISILIILYLHLVLKETWLAILVPIPVLIAGALKFRQDILNPLASDFEKCFSSPNYEQYVAFIEHFHNDFKNIVDAYTINRGEDEKIYVFIDDLDRCEIPKAANLLQALNLMIASNPRIIFIIGLDRMKVAAGLAVKYETILPYLNTHHFAIQLEDKSPKKSIKGLEFGYEFIEKFIQVPFSVPQPDKINIKKLIEEMTPEEDETNNLHSTYPSTKTKDFDAIDNEVKKDFDAIDNEVKKEREEIKAEVTRDSEKVREIALMVSPALDNNPRRMKQFINLFRLRVFIATNTGLLGEGKYLTLEQLGKFVAITLKWPLLITNLDVNPRLLNELQRIANNDDENKNGGDISQHAKYWSSEIKLIALLKYGCDTELSERYSLENLDVKTLLKVSPKAAN